MKKFECKGCELHCELTPKETCLLPKHCPFAEGYEPVWHEVKEEDPKLPKLTVDVFERPDFPGWARYVAVCADGSVCVFLNKPTHRYRMYWYDPISYWEKTLVGVKYDSSDWQNSLIERPAKTQLPDWCQAGKYVYDASCREYLYVREKDYDWYVDPVARGRIKQARKRKFNDKEMKALVGKVIENPNIALLVNAYGKLTGEIGTDCGVYTAESLMDNDFVIDGKPCFKLEHLENGKWIE